jgi:2-oxo-4-hydroxy-4-carboxy-5-ureidoimidazoline decarboxylase
MDLDELNRAPEDELVQALSTCADIPAWVAALVDGRPYEDVGRLLARADALARRWSDAEIERALAQHPRIGERAAGSGEEAAMSAREQSAVAGDPRTRARLRAGNEAYEARFDRVFLIRAAGRSESQVLTALDERLGNDPETERDVVASELREIAVLRLERLVTSTATERADR